MLVLSTLETSCTRMPSKRLLMTQRSKRTGKTSETLVRLGGVRYRTAIDHLETECMDPETEDHYKLVLSEWKKDEDNIKDELKEIGAEIRDVGTKMTDVMKKLYELTTATVTNRKEASDEGRF